MNSKTKFFLIGINFATILISIYKIYSFILEFNKAFFEWWLPLGKIFSYIHFYQFVTFFVIPLSFGVYFAALILYLLTSIILLLRIRKRIINWKTIILSFIILVGVLGSSFIFIGE